MKKIYLVTGAAGFLGGTVCRQLINRGEHVRALTLPNDPTASYIPEEAEICTGDISVPESLEQFFDTPSDSHVIVLHIASIVTVNPEFDSRLMAVNYHGTQNIIEQCRKHPRFLKLVYCGSTGAIPELPTGQPITEVQHYDEKRVVGCYSQSKALACQAVLDAAADGLDACIVLPSGIMGPEDFAEGETTKTLIKIIKGEMPIGINGSFNLADVRDLAAGCIAAADKGRKGQSYILANKVVSFKQFANLVCAESGCRPIKVYLSCRLARFMASLMTLIARHKGQKPLMTTFSVYNLERNNNFDSSKAIQELGYSCRSYIDTIRDEVAWLKKEHRI